MVATLSVDLTTARVVVVEMAAGAPGGRAPDRGEGGAGERFIAELGSVTFQQEEGNCLPNDGCMSSQRYIPSAGTARRTGALQVRIGAG